MDEHDKNKLKDVLSSIDPVEFKWDESNMSVGVIAQEIGAIGTSDTYIMSDTSTIDLGNITIGPSGWANGSSISFASSNTLNAGTTEYGNTTIKTARSTIDIDELADMMETLKKRLLILTPNFEQHEKYPMLKQLYDEYKAMERLLSGPDCDIDE
jgi:hypothetical protein